MKLNSNTKIIIGLTWFSVLSLSNVQAQVGIGTPTPNNSAQLEVKSTNKGVLIPRVALTGTTDNTTVTTGNVTSLLVYNTATVADVIAGYYYWNGTKWSKLLVKEDLPAETVTTLTNNGNGTYTYVSENGTSTVIDIPGDETVTTLTNNGDGTYTYVSENGTSTVIDIPGDETVTTLTDNGDRTFTYLNEAGASTVIDFPANETTTTVVYNGNGTYSLMNEDSVVQVIRTQSFGDVKYGFQAADHDGWVKLDGRPITSLTADQQTAATNLGFAGNLPDGTDRVAKQKTVLNSTGGANSVTLTQANIPNYDMTATTSTNGNHAHSGTTSTNGDHSHGHNAPGGQGNWGLMRTSNGGNNTTLGNSSLDSTPGEPDIVTGGSGLAIYNSGNHSHNFGTSTDGNHTHTVTVNSAGGGAAVNVEDAYLGVNMFIFLGN